MLKSIHWLFAGTALLTLLTPAWADSKQKKEEAEFVGLLKALPGDYDNLTQTEDESGKQHAAVVLSIKPLQVATVGRLVMLVRETAADDRRRLLAQRIWILEHTKDHLFVQRVYLFKEPQRWVNAGDDLLLMQSLLPDDLAPLAGCELLWTKTDTGFIASTRPHACRPAPSSEGQLIEISAELRGDDLIMNEQQAGVGGRLPAAVDPAMAYHFQRRGG
jgi:hypothetical protein